jgi:hypothetical protein
LESGGHGGYRHSVDDEPDGLSAPDGLAADVDSGVRVRGAGALDVSDPAAEEARCTTPLVTALGFGTFGDVFTRERDCTELWWRRDRDGFGLVFVLGLVLAFVVGGGVADVDARDEAGVESGGLADGDEVGHGGLVS